MLEADRFKLLGRYKTPRFKYGQQVECAVRGWLTIVELHDAPIPWPVGINKPGEGEGAHKSLVVFKDLAKAVRRESLISVCHWFGVSPATVRKWRRALGVEANNEGTLRRRSEASSTPAFRRKVLTKAWAKARDPVRRAKIAAAKRGKKRPPHVLEALRKANLGRPLTAEHRKKLIKAQRKRGARPPKAGRPWTAKEDALLRKLPAAEVAKRTGRTVQACYDRRRVLGLPDGRRRKRR